jgi:histidinol phosphatase-like enzyme
MLLRAGADLQLDLANSRIVGDAVSDLAAGKAAGLSAGVLVATGYGERDIDAARALAADGFEVSFGD